METRLPVGRFTDMKKPNVPMNHPITTCRHKVDRKKYDDGWDRIWGDGVETVFDVTDPEEVITFDEPPEVGSIVALDIIKDSLKARLSEDDYNEKVKEWFYGKDKDE